MSDALFAFALAYRCVITIGGGALTAGWAPQRPQAHALVLGCIGTVVGLAGAIAMREAGPLWYGLAVAFTGLPCTLLGAHFARRP